MYVITPEKDPTGSAMDADFKDWADVPLKSHPFPWLPDNPAGHVPSATLTGVPTTVNTCPVSAVTVAATV